MSDDPKNPEDAEPGEWAAGSTLTDDGRVIPYRESPVFLGPEPGGVEFLIRGDCKCGWRCACPEGWTWPKCPNCGEQVLPDRSEPGKCMAYAAIYGEEQRILAVVRGWTK